MTGDATVLPSSRPSTVAEEIGVPEETLFAAAEGFGLGMGGMEATCGAVSGAVMLAGFKNSCADPKNPKTKAATYQLTREITRQFAEKNHALVCKELKGVRTVSAMRLRSRKRYYNDDIMNSDEFILEVPAELRMRRSRRRKDDIMEIDAVAEG